MLYLMYCMYCFLCFTKPLAASPPQILQPFDFEENSAQRCCQTCRGSNPPIVHIVLSIPLAERRPGSHTRITGRYIHCMAVFLAKWRPFLQKIMEKSADQLKTTAIVFFCTCPYWCEDDLSLICYQPLDLLPWVCHFIITLSTGQITVTWSWIR